MRKLTILFALAFVVGCVPPSMNLQRSALRGAGDTAVTVILDSSSDSSYKESLTKIKGIAEAILKFLEDGKVANLTRSQIGVEITKLVPAKYKGWADQLLAAASGTVVDVDKIEKIGVNNIARLKAFLKGTLSGTNEYKEADRPPEPELPKADGEGPVQPDTEPTPPEATPAQPDSA